MENSNHLNAAQLIKESGNRLRGMVRKVPGCVTKDKAIGFSLHLENGVRWGLQTKTKWGEVQFHPDRLLVVLDYPVGAFNETELAEMLGLPSKGMGIRDTGVRTRHCPSYDTVQISYYACALATFAQYEERLLQVMDMIVRKARL